MTNDLSGFSVGQSDQPNPPAPPQLPVKPLAMPMGSLAKEQMEAAPVNYGETAPVVELAENEAVPENVSSWMEKLEQGEDIQLPQSVVQDDQVLVQSVGDANDEQIVLPMTEAQVTKGLHEHLFTGARWLAEWCVRLVKKFHGHVVYRLSGLRSQP
ncbi:hypothetical protein A3B57_03460 [Microgenomates group bacterium RIFCSPLOWO2_01_FULL_47_10]|nr:MAG: hypothetical protein A3B57_03460 [Microgenomates group bacterium RIFCSPLOWO2_01_FULL_47_10]